MYGRSPHQAVSNYLEPSPVVNPHFHIGPATGVDLDEMIKAHLPTGHIAIEDVTRVLIRDFSIKPLRPDWEKILTESQQTGQ